MRTGFSSTVRFGKLLEITGSAKERSEAHAALEQKYDLYLPHRSPDPATPDYGISAGDVSAFFKALGQSMDNHEQTMMMTQWVKSAKPAEQAAYNQAVYHFVQLRSLTGNLIEKVDLQGLQAAAAAQAGKKVRPLKLDPATPGSVYTINGPHNSTLGSLMSHNGHYVLSARSADRTHSIYITDNHVRQLLWDKYQLRIPPSVAPTERDFFKFLDNKLGKAFIKNSDAPENQPFQDFQDRLWHEVREYAQQQTQLGQPIETAYTA